MTLRSCLAAAAASLAFATAAADFGSPGGPPPANHDEISATLRQDPYDLELLISFGTSKGGSAGHLALALRDGAPGDDLVYSANFYADRDPKHAEHHYTDNLMATIPKKEYLYGTASSLGPKGSFGLDFGEVYKRSVIGVRVRGVPAAEREKLAAFFRRLNADFHARAKDTEYHKGEITYDYLRLNCAKTIGSAFRYGAGYEDLEIESASLLGRIRVVAALNANLPTEMAMKLLEAWNRRGYGMDVVLYRKYPGSSYFDPLEEEKISFMYLPNRFPSVLSRDFRRDHDRYRDYDNLYAMYLLYNMSRYFIGVDGEKKQLVIERRFTPRPYAEASKFAAEAAKSDESSFQLKEEFKPKGKGYDETKDNEPASDAMPDSAPC
jgi:hypothetical protein